MIDLKIKEWFFDRQRVKSAATDANRRALSKIGAFVRARARSFLQRRKSIAPAGSPPSVHSSDPVATLRFILFGYSPTNDSVVIGPVKIERASNVISSLTVPELQEFGGTARIRRRATISGGARERTAHYSPHPFMGPSLTTEIANGTIASAWAGSLQEGGG